MAYERACELPPHARSATQGQLDRAYEILINSASRRVYDRLETTPIRRKRQLTLNNPLLLAISVVILVAVLGLVWVPLYGSRFRSFSAGDRLVDVHGASFGVVVKGEEMHQFQGGVSAPAYLVEMSSTKELRWFPATDLQAHCRHAR